MAALLQGCGEASDDEAAAAAAAGEPAPSEVIVRLNGYLVDVAGFVGSHPGGRAKIERLFSGGEGPPDASRDFNSHFGHTVRAWRSAAAEYERRGGAGRMEVALKDGANRAVVGSVVIVGRAG